MTEETDDTTDPKRESERTRRPDGWRDAADADADDPLSDLARRVREKRETQRQREGGTEDGPSDSTGDSATVSSDLSDAGGEDGSGDELFEEMDVSDVDTDAVWESVLTEEADGEREESDPISPNVDIDSTVTVESTVGENHIVPKDDYCESCQYFSSPPEVTCSYEDAAIVEILESGQFRVRNCPVVEGFVNTDGSVVEREDNEGIAEETPSD